MFSAQRIALALVPLVLVACDDSLRSPTEATGTDAAVAASSAASSVGASTVTIDFETDGSGNPLVGFIIPANEYAPLGLLSIVDSDGAVGFSNVQLTNPLNVGTPISGKYLTVGAFANTPNTFVELTFAPGFEAHSVSFDWLTGARAGFVRVSLFGIGGVPLGIVDSPATGGFINPAGFTVPAGSFSVAGLGLIERIVIEDEPGAIRGLGLDNLQWEVGLFDVDIDIKPGSGNKTIYPKSKRFVPVAILGSSGFDVRDINRRTLGFGPSRAEPVRRDIYLEDVNGDGFMDLVSHYRQVETGLSPGDTQACVTGQIKDGGPFLGCSAVRVNVPGSDRE